MTVVAGAGWGAGIGTAIEPGGGTIVGGLLGGAVGLGLGLVGGKALADHMKKADEKAEEKLSDQAQDKACTTCKTPNPCEHLKKGSGDGDYRGGAHGDPKKDVGTSSPSGDGKDSHHMPAKGAYKGLGLDPADGPAIQMDPKDHAETHTYGGGGQDARDAQGDMIKNGDFDKAFEQDVDDVRRIAKAKGEEGKYDKAIEEARAYKDCLKDNKLLPTGGAP